MANSSADIGLGGGREQDRRQPRLETPRHAGKHRDHPEASEIVRPLTVLNAIVLGSSVAITFGLVATLVIFLVLSGETPRFREELPLLARYAAIFVGLTALAAVSFIGMARNAPWRRWAQLALWGALAGLALLYASTRP